VATIPVSNPGRTVVVNPASNLIYIPAPSGVNVIDGASNTVVAVLPAAATADAAGDSVFTVNPVTNHIYIAPTTADTGLISVLDGITNLTSEAPDANTPVAMAVNPVTNKIYVPNLNDPSGNSVFTVISEQQVQPIPLPVTIQLQGQPNVHVTVNRNPQFQITASSNFQPVKLPLQNVFFQLDTWEGQWQLATPSGANFSAQLTSVPLGNHVLYAYSTDAQATATLWPANLLISPIAAFAFTELQGATQMSLTSNNNPALAGTAVTFTATVTPVGVTVPPEPTGTVTFSDGATALGTATLNANAQALFTTSTLSPGTHTITATYSSDVNFASSSAQLQETINGCVPNRTVASPPNTQSGNFNSTKEVCFVIQSAKQLFFNCSQMMQRTITVNGTLFQASACDSSKGKSVKLAISPSGKYFFDVSAGNPSWSSISFWNQ
jgi:hypothetical protein